MGFVIVQYIDLIDSPSYMPSDFGVAHAQQNAIASGMLSLSACYHQYQSQLADEDELNNLSWGETDVDVGGMGAEVRVVKVVAWLNGKVAPLRYQPQACYWVFVRGGNKVLLRTADIHRALAVANDFHNAVAQSPASRAPRPGS